MALSSHVKIDVSAILSVVRDMGKAEAPLSKSVAMALASGTGANQADVVFADTRTIAGSATDALDLIGGGLVDALGTAFAPAKIKTVLVVAAPTNPNIIQLVRPATNGVPILIAASDGIPIPPGGAVLLAGPGAAGLASVTAGTGDLLNIVNTGAGNCDYDLLVIGTSA